MKHKKARKTTSNEEAMRAPTKLAVYKSGYPEVHVAPSRRFPPVCINTFCDFTLELTKNLTKTVM